MGWASPTFLLWPCGTLSGPKQPGNVVIPGQEGIRVLSTVKLVILVPKKEARAE